MGVGVDQAGKEHAAQRYALSDPDKAGEYAPAEGIAAKEYPGNTSHFVVMDRFGNAFSQTQTVRDWFGCGIVVDGLGFVLNNAMSDFSAKPGALTSQGLTYGSANSIQGGKTPLSSMAPSMVCSGKTSGGSPRRVRAALMPATRPLPADST